VSDPETAPYLRKYLKDEGFDLKDDCCWEEIADHVKVHKYYLDTRNSTDTDWHDALDSWYDTVFKPLKLASDSEEVHRAFPDKTSGQLYLDVSHHWLFMKLYQHDATPEMAAHDFTIRYGQGLERWYKRLEGSGLY